MEITDTDLAWLAGLLEGEGSFMMGRNTVNGKVYLYPKIVVTMTDHDVILRASKLFETGVYTLPEQSGRKQQWRTQINGSRAASLMLELKHQMGERRSGKIAEILEAYGDIESTSARRAKSCSETATKRWAKYGTRSGRL